MIMPTELSPPLGSNPQESNISIKLKSNYIASTEITFVITKTMIQGDDSSKLQLRKVLIITYTVRLLLLSSLYFVVFSIALYIFDPSSLYFFINFASIFILFLLLLGHQTYVTHFIFFYNFINLLIVLYLLPCINKRYSNIH
ncbi:hypothetical protein K502DRAFT_44734 [Neoconidiobolus thromboides FSU 785]|nr:hypothetical protein K502DRAFT_44734 [Neoconidiobolus thromboides FSU 785]